MILTVLLAVGICTTLVAGHGRMIDPPSRSSMNKYGFPENPRNNCDQCLNCGGWAHFKALDGKCGLCGDLYDGERLHEAGGTYANGIIVRSYKAGETITIKTELTANHGGYYEFSLCPVNDPTVKATQECLDQNRLIIASGPDAGGYRWNIPSRTNGFYDVQVKLPDDVTCSQCFLQWKWPCGNRWGIDPDTGNGCQGCGLQEHFFACADIEITA